MAFTCEGICRKLKVGPMIISALVSRIVFCLHCLVAIWRIFVSPSSDPLYWLVLFGILGLFIETVVTLYVRKGAEYKWFCPSVFFYLATIVPCIWILEFGMLSERIEGARNNTNCESKNTDAEKNDPNWDGTLPELIELPQDQWVTMTEQLLLFVLILGRWMLPKGKISRDALSQLLLVYIGMAADIMELFETFEEKQVRYSRMLTVIILGVWSVSLLQFTLVLTVSKSRKSRPGFNVRDPTKPEIPSSSTGKSCKSGVCCNNEVAGILTTMVLQDGPFLVLRLVLLFRFDVRSHMHIFFTMKNALVLLLMLYRLFVLFNGRREQAQTQAQAQTRAHDQDEVIAVVAIEEDKTSKSSETE